MTLNKKPDIPQGDSEEITCPIKNKVGGAPASLVGASIEWELAVGPNKPALITKIIGGGITVIDAPGGVIEIKITAAETALLPAGEYFHFVRVSFPDARVKTVFRQWLTISEVD